MRDQRGGRLRRLRRYCAAVDGTQADGRGRLSLTVVEAIVATLFVLAVAVGSALAPPAPTAEPDALTRQATDAASLVGLIPAEGPGTLLGVACGSPVGLDDRATRLHGVAAAGLPNGAFVSLRTGVGPVGRPLPETARMRTAVAMIPCCTATLGT